MSIMVGLVCWVERLDDVVHAETLKCCIDSLTFVSSVPASLLEITPPEVVEEALGSVFSTPSWVGAFGEGDSKLFNSV